ncbi:PH domain-containing protein [Janibacter sp. GS2]|uniref:PH domain-containing protein n=1 Tax=Janibacter sp. GS2 TaxID=3442646 RepID=UPI003EB7FB71
MDNTDISSWTLVEEIPIPEDVTALLVEGEQAVVAYKTSRDSAAFTTKRLIVRDAQGLSGKKVEVHSVPYSRIDRWSTENAGGMFDFNSQLQMWTRAGHITIELGRKVDVRRLDQLIAWAVLNAG